VVQVLSRQKHFLKTTRARALSTGLSGPLVRPIEKCCSANAGTISDIPSITHSFGVEVINAHPSASADLVLGHGARGAAMDDVKGGLLGNRVVGCPAT